MNAETTPDVQTTTDVQTQIHVAPAYSFKEIAMQMVNRGIPVIPLPPGEKGAKLPKWQELASTDPVQVTKWNDANPHYNCGAVAKRGQCWFLDCDVRDLASYIQNETGQLFPATLSVKTNRGIHYYFKHSAASESLNKNIQIKGAEGKVLGDVKVHNAYVVAPGSTHPSGKQYEVENHAAIIESPEWLVNWIKDRHLHDKQDEQKDYTNGEKVKEGGRNNLLFSRNCQLRNVGITQSEALIVSLALNNDCCVPPLEETEVSKIVESAYSYQSSKQPLHKELIQNPDLPALTDLGNAQRLVKAEGKNIRYCYKTKSWYVWDDRKWAKDENGEIHRIAKRTVKCMLHEAANLDDERCKVLVSHEQKCESEGRLNAMVNLARSEKGVSVQLVDFDADSLLFNCLNATIDLATGKPREHCRADLISKITPVEYAPNAECPTWLSFLDTVTENNSDLKDYLQRCVGYSLTGETREHALFLLCGTGANGKSTFLEVLRHIFGDYSQTADFSSFLVSNSQSVRNDLAKLNGARFVTASESDSGKRLDETVVKQMTGGDSVSARFLYGEHFEFKPQFKLWLGTNHKPTIRGQDEGVWRRIRLIPFETSIPREKQDHALAAC
jgi:putative DNA primase/helicase